MEILGGLNIKSTSKDKILKNDTEEYVAGGMTQFNIKSFALDFGLIGNDKKALLSMANKLLGTIQDEAITIKLYQGILSLPDADLTRAIIKMLKINEPLVYAFRTLYYAIYDLNNIILATAIVSVTGSEQDVTIDSLQEAKLPAAIWAIVKSYKHKGFCPCEPTVRIAALLTFPIDQLIMAKSESPIKLTFDHSKIFAKIAETKKNIDERLSSQKLVRPKTPSGTHDLRWHMKVLLDILVGNFAVMEKYESEYIKLAEHVIEYTKEIVQINNSLLRRSKTI